MPDPYAERPGARMYASGDRARRLADGNIEFLGRSDRQVKVRGFRIELGEIQAALEAHPSVAHALAITREDGPSGRYLLAYVVPVSGGDCDEAELARHLALRLPGYMLPQSIMTLANLPLSANGKLDLGALPLPVARAASQRAPGTEAEVFCAAHAPKCWRWNGRDPKTISLLWGAIPYPPRAGWRACAPRALPI